MKEKRLPAHIAIIMDGNGRWAKKRNLPRVEGHRVGIDNIRDIIKAAEELKLGYITFFAFSTENWKRPKHEVSMLMISLERFLKKEMQDLNERNIRFKAIGRAEPVPQKLQRDLKDAQELTKNNTGLTVILAFNYGSRAELVDAAKKISQSVQKGDINLAEIDEHLFAKFLYTAGIPDPDMLIRTSGEMRISNFLLWQLSYAELYFTKTYWPDFKKVDLIKAIKDFQKRDRRFGDIKKED
jgi:undecaprenyl diphosphate synthase